MTNRRAYYDDLLALARDKRVVHGVTTAGFGLTEVRKIYKAEGIRLDYWPLPYKIKALYMCADGDSSVAVQKALPDEPKLFALVHELKHHYRDQEALGAGMLLCGDYNANELIEKGAEVFAAEFIYPVAEFVDDLRGIGINTWTPENVVNLKRNCKAKVSYTYLCKRLERLALIPAGQFSGVKFQKLEERMFGVPFHRRRKSQS
jgi:Zn-dependent peptidase ImmA (M78 family)